MKIRLPLMFAFFLATHWLVLSQPDGQIDRYLNQYPEADRNGDGMLTRDDAKTHRQKAGNRSSEILENNLIPRWRQPEVPFAYCVGCHFRIGFTDKGRETEIAGWS